MSIRYYLLLLAGIITTLVMVGSFLVDSVILSENIQKARQEAAVAFKDHGERERAIQEESVASQIAEKLSQVNAMLEAIAKFDALGSWFAPTEENKKKGTWNKAASLIGQEEWIHFLQNTTEGKLLSLVIPQKGPFFEVKTIPIQEGLYWTYILGSPSYEKAFLGVQVPVKSVEEGTQEINDTVGKEGFPSVLLLYDPKRLAEYPLPSAGQEEGAMLPDQVPFGGGIEVDPVHFWDIFAKAIAFAKDPSVHIPPPMTVPFPLIEDSTSSARFSCKLQEDFLRRIHYGNELFLIWQASVLQEMGVFVPGHWPEAMSFSGGVLAAEQAFFVRSALDFSQPAFDDRAFLAAHPPQGHPFSSSSYVLQSPRENQAFLVNTIPLLAENGGIQEKSLLSIGFDLTSILHNFVTGLHRYGVIFSGGKIVANLTPSEKSPIDTQMLTPLFSTVLHVPSGLVDIAGMSYHFVRLQPDPNLDLHFFLFGLQQEEFSFLYAFQTKARAILETAMFDRRILEIFTVIVLWILLLDVSRKITGPISALTQALQHVKQGRWDLIEMPKISFRKKNEIRQLFDSFHNMVEGMKEKEKITGILNKVVSEEVAKEILKTDVQLGGEERIVTMLFADIRGFTKLTQNMPPQEVIGFLNRCMTKMSNVVEDNKGVIDKYMGDGLMALYGAPIAYENSPLYAIVTGLEIVSALKQWNEQRLRDRLDPIYVGIGIHTGSVFVGNMGAQNRLNYTVIGSHVNLASRLCSAAGPEEVLITEDTYLQPCVKDSVEVQDKGLMTFKGFDDKKQVFKVIKLKTKDAGKLLMSENSSDV